MWRVWESVLGCGEGGGRCGKRHGGMGKVRRDVGGAKKCGRVYGVSMGKCVEVRGRRGQMWRELWGKCGEMCWYVGKGKRRCGVSACNEIDTKC